jgi:hypothetical protein
MRINSYKVDSRLINVSTEVVVHSIYNNAINLMGKDNHNYTILSSKTGSVLTLSLLESDFKLLNLNILQNGNLSEGVLRIDCYEFFLKDAKIAVLQNNKNDFDIKSFYCELKNYLKISNNNNSLLGYFNKNTSPNMLIDKAINILHTVNCIEELYPYIGLGIGLTPSIDDCLVGMMCIYNKLDMKFKPFIDAPTTTVSKEMLCQAKIGYFNEYLVNLINSPTYENFEKVSSIGSSSGLDTLIGMLKAIEIIIN